ncbi:hypothetical protein P3W85_02425 [Cupriavidus basilensis]|uniref:Uncharacterized protein n=1 Tax=Cupriavidus basilensis TaxID=68895 RepID=A0ABT6AGT8_9BURK|nr:hypothetical protein [Cupriavidus basilensis]MDF3831816.1 hypothetical protein [Cupriavidus basilensis]
MSNAERQAAYRARRKASVTVTENAGVFRGEVMHQDVGGLEDAMAELRAELEATKAELAEAHETIDDMTGQLARMRLQRNEAAAVSGKLKAELAAAKKGVEKSVTRNGNPVQFDFMVDLVSRVRKARSWTARHAIADLPGWEAFAADSRTTSDMRKALWNAMTGDSMS